MWGAMRRAVHGGCAGGAAHLVARLHQLFSQGHVLDPDLSCRPAFSSHRYVRPACSVIRRDCIPRTCTAPKGGRAEGPLGGGILLGLPLRGGQRWKASSAGNASVAWLG
eukprot:scaffold16900_cov105-Isochrysis_galbana.AAC.10